MEKFLIAKPLWYIFWPSRERYQNPNLQYLLRKKKTCLPALKNFLILGETNNQFCLALLIKLIFIQNSMCWRYSQSWRVRWFDFEIVVYSSYLGYIMLKTMLNRPKFVLQDIHGSKLSQFNIRINCINGIFSKLFKLCWLKHEFICFKLIFYIHLGKILLHLYIISIPAALKQTLQSQTNDLKAYKLKVQSLQNELIKVGWKLFPFA
jgi:hypothetical protein